jgi:putative FmdB family regulatory protein|tara:strand:- start:3372 stop:3557 length:186 start_codon:yes stop_codon:yes gene_type:complete
MPIYICKCKACKTEEDVLMKTTDPMPKCDNCGCTTEKGIARTNFALKGGGWEKDGYQKGGA